MTDTNIYAFVYGTLRPGGALDGMMPGTHVSEATTGGFLYRHYGARFPVLRKAPAPAPMVTGDLFIVDVAKFAPIMEMELGAGYEAEWTWARYVDPYITNAALLAHFGVRTVRALTFTWPDYRDVGPRIFGGNWLSAEALSVCHDLNANAGFARRKDNR